MAELLVQPFGAANGSSCHGLSPSSSTTTLELGDSSVTLPITWRTAFRRAAGPCSPSQPAQQDAQPRRAARVRIPPSLVASLTFANACTLTHARALTPPPPPPAPRSTHVLCKRGALHATCLCMPSEHYICPAPPSPPSPHAAGIVDAPSELIEVLFVVPTTDNLTGGGGAALAQASSRRSTRSGTASAAAASTACASAAPASRARARIAPQCAAASYTAGAAPEALSLALCQTRTTMGDSVLCACETLGYAAVLAMRYGTSDSTLQLGPNWLLDVLSMLASKPSWVLAPLACYLLLALAAAASTSALCTRPWCPRGSKRTRSGPYSRSCATSPSPSQRSSGHFVHPDHVAYTRCSWCTCSCLSPRSTACWYAPQLATRRAPRSLFCAACCAYPAPRVTQLCASAEATLCSRC